MMVSILRLITFLPGIIPRSTAFRSGIAGVTMYLSTIPTERLTMSTTLPTILPIGSTVTVRGLGASYIVRSTPYAMTPYSGLGITLEASDGFRFWWSADDVTIIHQSYT